MSSDKIARMGNGSQIDQQAFGASALGTSMSYAQTNARVRAQRQATTRKVLSCMAALAVIAFLSLGIMGAAGQYYPYSTAYHVYLPDQVLRVIAEHFYNACASLFHFAEPHSNQWILENVDGYWAIAHRASVVAITIICAVLLSLAGMLYQNVFKNPIAGPGMLGVSSGVGLGVLVLVYVYGEAAASMVGSRYALCYGFGALILVAVLLAGKRLSGPRKQYDIVTMLLIGSIFSQLIGFVTSYITLFVWDDTQLRIFTTVSQMLVVDTSELSWGCLAVASLVALVPVYFLRSKMNALSFDPDEVRLLGLNYGRLRGVALVCGAIMLLAAQVHTGMVGLISLIVPFLARSWFGCEFSKQAVGCICISTVLLLLCRDLADLIPFVGDGLAIGSIVGFVAMPLFLIIVSRNTRGWE